MTSVPSVHLYFGGLLSFLRFQGVCMGSELDFLIMGTLLLDFLAYVAGRAWDVFVMMLRANAVVISLILVFIFLCYGFLV